MRPLVEPGASRAFCSADFIPSRALIQSIDPDAIARARGSCQGSRSGCLPGALDTGVVRSLDAPPTPADPSTRGHVSSRAGSMPSEGVSSTGKRTVPGTGRKAGTPGASGPTRAEARSLKPTVDSPRLRFPYTGPSGARRAYEDELRASLDAMLREAGDYFAMGGRLHETVRRLASRLEAEGITYALL